MTDISDPAVISTMFLDTPGGVSVTSDGVTAGGHFEDVPESLFDDSETVVSAPSVVVPAESFPNICLDHTEGVARGIGECVEVSSKRLGTFVWTVRGVEPATAPGEIRLLLANA